MMRFLLFVSVLFLPCIVIAAPIVVRSGEHGNFSRLVLRITPDVAWRALEGEGEYVLELPDHEDGFDTSRVFQRITNERIMKIDSGASELSLSLNCNCSVKAFRVGSRFLVLDVFEAEDPNIESNLLRADDFPRADETLRVGSQITTQLPTQESGPIKKSAETETVRSNSVLPVVSIPQPTSDTVRTVSPTFGASVANEEATVNALAAARDRLSEEFGTASTRGVLRTSPSMALPQNTAGRPDIDVSVFDSSEEIQVESANEDPVSNIRVTTSSDTIQNRVSNALVTLGGLECIDPPLVEVSSWGVDGSLQESLGSARANLFGEFDIPNHQAVIELAKKYIYFGFGAEAISTLNLVPENRTIYKHLYEISETLEFGGARSSQTLANQIECSSSVALWGVLSREKIPSDVTLNKDAVLLALNGLPIHLRRIVAPVLSDKLLEYGDRDAANIAMRSINRLPEELDMKANLAQANIDLTDGNTDTAEKRLVEVVESNSVQSARALVKLIDFEMESGKSIDAETAKLAEAYSLELRDHHLGQELDRVHVLALAKSGQFDAAFEKIEDLEVRGGENRRGEILVDIVKVLTEDAADSTFLKLIFRQMKSTLDGMPSNVKLDIADRLLDLGFAVQARNILSNEEPSIAATKREKLIRARASLALGRPSATLSMLFEVDGVEAASLRAQATSELGQRLEAYQAFEEMDDVENAAMNARLSSDWKNVLSADDPVFGRLVDPARNDTLEDGEIDGLLGRSEQAILESANTRAAILDVIGQFEKQDSSP